MFSERPIYTKDYEEKLFQYDKYTAITTCGAAYVNGKKIECLVEEMISSNKKDRSYWKKELEKKVEELAEYLNIEVHHHLEQFGAISESRLIITHFDKTKEETSIYKICINDCSKERWLMTSAPAFRITKSIMISKLFVTGKVVSVKESFLAMLYFFLSSHQRLLKK